MFHFYEPLIHEVASILNSTCFVILICQPTHQGVLTGEYKSSANMNIYFFINVGVRVSLR